MPIKFRCQHCRQLLGISRSKAGNAVDCPKCGRLVRVPATDGNAKAPPEPEWDLRDPALARALDELAGIGQEVPEEDRPPQEPLVIAVASSPAPLPAPVVLEPLPPVMPVPQNAPMRSGHGASPHQGRAPESRADSQIVAGTIARLGTNPPRGAAASGISPPRWLPARRGVLVSLLCGLGLLGASLLSYRMGHRAAAVNPAAGASVPGRGEAGAVRISPADAASPALSGRITYINQSGESQPDRGARVIVLPTQREGTARLSVVGFRPTDSVADLKLATSSARALGGDLAVAGDDGSFRVALPGAGEYRLVVLSHYQAREPDPPPAALRGLLESYFERPDQLLGRFACHEARIRYKGTGTDVWDYSFAKP